MSRQVVRAPNEINRRENKQLHDCGGYNTADHRRGDAFHDISAGAMTPQDRQKATDDYSGRHCFRPDAFDCAIVNRVSQFGSAAHFSFSPPLIVSEIEVEQHYHSGLRIKTRQRYQADPHRDAQIISGEVKQPECAD
jgi:hypothetical protein